MKTKITILALLVSTVIFSQISNIRIKSNIPLMIDTRSQVKDTVYISIDQWVYSSKSQKYVAIVVDYVKEAGTFKEINKKVKSFSKEEVNGLFTMLNNPITIGENYSDEMDVVLLQGLIIDTQNNLLPDGKTIYGGSPSNWQIDN